jgi:agmatinase
VQSARRGSNASTRAVVIPFGLEASVSYGGGTAAGPAAILTASQQLELYDDELQGEPYLDYGVAALRAPEIDKPIEAALQQLAGIVETCCTTAGFHSCWVASIPDRRRHPPVMAATPTSWRLQFDAHADLRDGYQGVARTPPRFPACR